ncbi:MAG: hypothetical protein ACLUVV_07085 [Christensenellales bacterium]
MLRCVQIGLSVVDLERLSLGMVYDMMTEYNNDDVQYPYIATQEDMDRL